jgi:hypothetical protein
LPPFRLSDAQLEQLMAAAAPLDPDKRALLLTRVAARLRCNGSVEPTDGDVEAALTAGLRGLRHGQHDAA